MGLSGEPDGKKGDQKTGSPSAHRERHEPIVGIFLWAIKAGLKVHVETIGVDADNIHIEVLHGGDAEQQEEE